MAVQNIEHISAADKLQPLYVIHGEEDLLRVEALDKMAVLTAVKTMVLSLV